MNLRATLNALRQNLDAQHAYPTYLSPTIVYKFGHFRSAMFVVALTLNDRIGRQFLRKYQHSQRGRTLDRLKAKEPIDRETLRLMITFCDDAARIEAEIERHWPKILKQLKSGRS